MQQQKVFKKVSVKDALPTEIGWHLCYINNAMFIFQWIGWWNDDGIPMDMVTHWVKEVDLSELIAERLKESGEVELPSDLFINQEVLKMTTDNFEDWDSFDCGYNCAIWMREEIRRKLNK